MDTSTAPSIGSSKRQHVSNFNVQAPTSFLLTGLSVRTRCVNRPNLASTSRSASSAMLLDASTRFRRFGMAFGSAG